MTSCKRTSAKAPCDAIDWRRSLAEDQIERLLSALERIGSSLIVISFVLGVMILAIALELLK